MSQYQEKCARRVAITVATNVFLRDHAGEEYSLTGLIKAAKSEGISLVNKVHKLTELGVFEHTELSTHNMYRLRITGKTVKPNQLFDKALQQDPDKGDGDVPNVITVEHRGVQIRAKFMHVKEIEGVKYPIYKAQMRTCSICRKLNSFCVLGLKKCSALLSQSLFPLKKDKISFQEPIE